VGLVVDQRPAHSPVAWDRSLVVARIFRVNIHKKKQKKINMFEGLVNLLPILKDLALTSPNVDLPEIKKHMYSVF
jgi:hypothetical protein